jgi:hypothetical protein
MDTKPQQSRYSTTYCNQNIYIFKSIVLDQDSKVDYVLNIELDA